MPVLLFSDIPDTSCDHFLFPHLQDQKKSWQPTTWVL